MARRGISEKNFTMDITKLNEALDNPDLGKELEEVFSFVETITGQKCNPDDFTPKNIEIWNQKFDEVLKQLFPIGGGKKRDLLP
jgi:hypothetical protein